MAVRNPATAADGLRTLPTCPLQGPDLLLAARPRQRGGGQCGVQGFQRAFRIADQTDRGCIVAPNFRRIDINLHHRLPAEELGEGEARAHRQHDIRLRQVRDDRILAQPHGPQRQGVPIGQGPFALGRGEHGGVEKLRQRLQGGTGLGGNDATARNDEELLGAP